MPGQEKEKSEGGEELDQEAIRNIASAVKGLIDQDKEKETVSQELTEVRKEVGELKEEFGKVKQGMHCDSSGRYCFETPEELSAFMEKQATKMEGIEAKIGEVIRISEAKPAPPGEPGLVGLAEENDFNKLSREQQQRLRGQVDKLLPHTMLIDILEDCSKSDHPKRCDLAGAVTKRFGAGVLAGKLSIEGKGKVMSLACTDKECRLQLEKEQGARIYKQDKRGKWHWIDEPVPEPSRI